MALMSVDEAIARVLGGVRALGAELVPVTEAYGRVLAETLHAKITQPPFDASAMDGYAVRAEDVIATPVELKLAGVSAAGRAFEGRVGKGEAARIFTGAPLPDGADTVVIQENTRLAGPQSIEILEVSARGRHIRTRGYDFREGDALIEQRQRLSSRHLLLAASMNHGFVPVVRKPVIAILPTGDELVPPGGSPRADQIVSSVPAGLKAAVESWGAEARILDIAHDTPDHLSHCIAQGNGADILVTIGGASVGEHDIVQSVLEKLGARFEVLKVAIRPGKPLMSGLLGQQRIMSLPGNPVSALVCSRIFLKPLIDRLLGLNAAEKLAERALAAPLSVNGDREHYMRGQFADNAVMPLSDQDSSLMAAFAKADCLIKRLPGAPALEEGAPVQILPLDF